MAHPDTLQVGHCYFIVHYYDEDLLIPSVTTLQYLGPDTGDDGTPTWLFTEGVSDDDATSDDQVLIGIPESQLSSVLELDGLITVLNELRAVLQPAPGVEVFLEKSDLLGQYPLMVRIEELLNSPAGHKLSLSIRYKDRCLFLRKGAERIALELFMKPLRSADENERLDRLMGERGVHPSTDYLADRGRTRIIEYRLPAEAASVADLCAALLVAVYRVTAADEIVISNE